MYAFRAAHEARDAKKKLDLRDEGGERVIAGRRTMARTAITEMLLRREVARDLEILMNTIDLAATEDLHEFQHVRQSILNFGFPDVGHRTIDELTVNAIRDEIDRALRTYEPRIVADSIEVARDHDVRAAELKIRFVVRADLACEPLNVPVEFVADVEIDTGKILINRL